MSRKKTSVIIPDDAEGNRDRGKIFVVTEVPAYQAEKWGNRVYLAMARSGIPIEPEYAAMGVAGLFLVGLRALTLTSWADAEPLLDEMMECVTIALPNNPSVARPLMRDLDIEEIGTYRRLRQEIIELHLGFTIAEGLSRLSGPKPTANDEANPSTFQS